jgi:CheY-like chemotaxis protein
VVQTEDLLHEALMMFGPQADAKGLELTFRVDGALPPWVVLDPDRVRQVLLNLVGNAVKFTELGGVRLVVRYDRERQSLGVNVEDTGSGLSAAQQARLFQRFSQVDGSSTRRHGGTGLGLAICKGLVEAMGGDIGVRSVIGQGSVFHFEIQAPEAEVPAEDQGGADVAPMSLDHIRVLVVDDNPVNRELARSVLEQLGAEVTEAADGLSGLEAAQALPVDVILLDIRMPGLDGPEVLARLRAEPGPNQWTPALAFTADVDLDRLGGNHRFDGLVRKPLSPSDLSSAVYRAANTEPVAMSVVEAAHAAP